MKSNIGSILLVAPELPLLKGRAALWRESGGEADIIDRTIKRWRGHGHGHGR